MNFKCIEVIAWFESAKGDKLYSGTKLTLTTPQGKSASSEDVIRIIATVISIERKALVESNKCTLGKYHNIVVKDDVEYSSKYKVMREEGVDINEYIFS